MAPSLALRKLHARIQLQHPEFFPLLEKFATTYLPHWADLHSSDPLIQAMKHQQALTMSLQMQAALPPRPLISPKHLLRRQHKLVAWANELKICLNQGLISKVDYCHTVSDFHFRQVQRHGQSQGGRPRTNGTPGPIRWSHRHTGQIFNYGPKYIQKLCAVSRAIKIFPALRKTYEHSHGGWEKTLQQYTVLTKGTQFPPVSSLR